MKTRRSFVVAALVTIAVAVAVLPACARDCAPRLREGWLRLPPMAMPMMAGFGRIENRCDAPITVIGASSPAFADVSLHQTSIVNGVSQMRAVPELQVTADAPAILQPGGLHLMLMQPRAPVKAGSTVEVQFALKGGGTLRGELVVRAAGE